MSMPVSSSVASHARTRLDGRSGALAALLALFLDLLWRVTIAPTGAPSIPETVVAAVARLTPTAIFGWATETFGSMAQNTLWAFVLVGIVGMGYWAGQAAGQLSHLGRFGNGRGGRRGSAAIVAAVLFLIITAGVFPLAREGFFAADSAFQGTLLAQAALFAAIWAVAWAGLSETPVAAAQTMTRDATVAESVSPARHWGVLPRLDWPRVSLSSAGGWRRLLPLAMFLPSGRPRRRLRRGRSPAEHPVASQPPHRHQPRVIHPISRRSSPMLLLRPWRSGTRVRTSPLPSSRRRAS